MRFSILSGPFAICRLDATAQVPAWAKDGSFLTITRTKDELSIICEQASVPPDTKAAWDFSCIQLQGPFDFSAIGILESFLAPLAEAAVPVFTVSTYDTDWILIQAKHWDKGLSVLASAGHELVA